MKAQRGFTLLEVILVLCIISMSTGIVMLALGQVEGSEKQAIRAANRFHADLMFATDNAIVSGRPSGIRFTHQGWEVVFPRWNEQQQWHWQAASLRGLSDSQWGEALLVSSNTFDVNDRSAPQVVILPDGQFPTFSLTLISRETRQKLLTLSSSGALPLLIQPYRESGK
jgi:general secretion pathway protein H